MKKTLIALALVAAVVPSAWGEAVVSSNIVGYEKISVPVNKMDLVGIQFQTVGTNGVINIQDITTEGWDGYGSDWLKVYNPNTSRYTTAYYVSEDMGGVYTDDTYETSLGAGWADDAQIVLDMTIEAGQAVWTQSEAGGKFVVAGEVTATNKVTVPVNKMTLVANPLPMAVDIQDITTEGWDGYGSDWIKIYDPDTSRYTTVYYVSEDMGGVYTDDTYETSLGAGWGDDAQIAVDTRIEVGQGFWVQSEAGGKLVFPTIPAN